MCLNPFIPDLKPACKPTPDVWIFVELRLEKVQAALR